MSQSAGKVRGAEELAPGAWLSVFKKRGGKKIVRELSVPGFDRAVSWVFLKF